MDAVTSLENTYMAYKMFFWFRAVLAFLLLGYAANTIYRFASASHVQSVWEIVFWALGPPLWFFLEYFMLDRGWVPVPDVAGKDAFLKSIKDYADYASKSWAAVLAAVLFLYTKKEQMENPIVRVFPHPPLLGSWVRVISLRYGGFGGGAPYG